MRLSSNVLAKLQGYCVALLAILFVSSVMAAEHNHTNQLGTLDEGKASYLRAKAWAKQHPGVPPPLTPQQEYEIFGKEGLPKPGSGIHVMPAAKMHYNLQQANNVMVRASILEKQGYISKYNQNAVNLLMFDKTASAEFSKNNTLKDQDTHLRRHISELNMAYDYQGVPNALVKDVIGFAPLSIYLPQGWTGAVEFFKPKTISGVCAYREINIKLTGSAANFAKEIVSEKINGKVTIIEVSGNNASGYTYNIEWWDKEFRRTLECASKVYSPKIKQESIELARNIDR